MEQIELMKLRYEVLQQALGIEYSANIDPSNHVDLDKVEENFKRLWRIVERYGT